MRPDLEKKLLELEQRNRELSADIAERKQAEAALRESEEKFRSLNASMAEGMALHKLICDASGKPVDYVMLDVNPAFEAITGLGREAVIGRRGSEVYGGEAPFLEIYAAVATTGRPAKFEKTYEPMNKTFAISVFSPAKGCFATVFLDITERKQAEQALRESEEKYKRLIETTETGYVILDDQGRVVDANAEYVRLTGRQRLDDILGRRVLEWTAPDELERNAREVKNCLEQGFVRNLEMNYVTPAGQVIPIEVNAAVLKVNGQVRIQTLCRDITARKRAETAMRENEERYRALFDRSLDCVYLCDFSGNFLDANPATLNLLGYQREDIATLNFAAVLSEDQLPLAFQSIEEIVSTGRQQRPLEFRIRAKDGQWVEVQVQSSLIYHDGQPYAIQGIARDLTERKRVEKDLARLAMAAEQADETIVIADTSGTILYANPAFEKTTGYTRAEALGQNPRILKSGRQDAEFYRRMWEVLQRGEVWHGHFTNKHKTGRLYEEEATLSPVRDAAGKIVNYVAVKRDVTKELQLKAQLRQKQKMEAIGTLAGGVAHDFNNILAIISMQASLLKSGGGLSPAQNKFTDEIGATVDRAAALTRQLLLFSRREMPQPRDLDLSETVTNTAKMLRRLLRESIEVQLKLAAEPMFIQADPSMMEQVLLNLAVNARDAMLNGGRLVIETTAVEFDEFAAAQSAMTRPGSFVCLSVSDSGAGIPPEILPKIFEPFFTTKGIGKGTGLGLATVFGIVQQHEGWINVYSEVGQGTTFKVYLPRLAGMNSKIIAQKMLATVPTGKETILLVEDEPALCAAIRMTLTNLGYRVLEASTGPNALTVWQKHHAEIHLLLTDLMMPEGMSGRELAQRLIRKNSKLKVIYMSGYSPEVVSRDFPLQEGVNFLAKPFQTPQLAQTIRDCLDKPA